jgi:GxxExxY protein
MADYYVDILVENKVIIELKASEGMAKEHKHQLINYLKATNLEISLLLKFGKQAQFKRKILKKICGNP